MNPPLLNIDGSFRYPLDFLIVLMVAIVFLAMSLRYIPGIPEPDLRFKSPFGKLPFFDGVVLYGLAFIFGCLIIKFIEMFIPLS